MMRAAPSEAARGLWRGDAIVLASRSKGRAQLLTQAGIPFVAVDSGLDERAVEKVARLAPPALAQRLATEKARRVSISYPNRIVIGADQILALDAEIQHKSRDRTEVVERLKKLRGRDHQLHSAVSCFRDNALQFVIVDTALIRMRSFSDRTLEAYVEAMGDRLFETVGAYEVEGLGVNLIERIEGDHFTIIGLPLLPLLSRFRAMGAIEGPEKSI